MTSSVADNWNVRFPCYFFPATVDVAPGCFPSTALRRWCARQLLTVPPHLRYWSLRYGLWTGVVGCEHAGHYLIPTCVGRSLIFSACVLGHPTSPTTTPGSSITTAFLPFAPPLRHRTLASRLYLTCARTTMPYMARYGAPGHSRRDGKTDGTLFDLSCIVRHGPSTWCRSPPPAPHATRPAIATYDGRYSGWRTLDRRHTPAPRGGSTARTHCRSPNDIWFKQTAYAA